MIIEGDNYGCLYDDYFIFNTDNIRNNRNNKYDDITLAIGKLVARVRWA